MSQNNVHAVLKAIINVFEGLRDTVAAGFEVAGPTLSTKLAVQQLDALCMELHQLYELASTMPLPDPVNGAYESGTVDSIAATGGLLGDRMDVLGRSCARVKQGIEDACNDLARVVCPLPMDLPESFAVNNLEFLTHISCMVGIMKQAPAFTVLVEGAISAIAALVMERLTEKLRNASAPESEPADSQS
jgi:hypothetical protein